MSRPHSARLSTLLALAAWPFAAGSSLAQTITEFPLPAPGATAGITRGADGNIWYGKETGRIGRITSAGVATDFTPPTITALYGIAIGPDGTVLLAAVTR